MLYYLIFEEINNLIYEKYFFNISGIYNFSIPKNIFTIEVKLWGSGGGSLNSGAGGYTFGIINVSEISNLMIQVGSPNIFLLNNIKNRTSAGERSSIYINSINNELLVAGGGGAGVVCNGGSGGGLIGENGQYCLNHNPSTCGSTYTIGGGGGTQISGGLAGTSSQIWNDHYSTGVNGNRNFGSRGHGKLNYWEGGPGGGGYYGGGSGGSACWSHSGGGGGSGFILQSSIIKNGITIRGNLTIPGNSNDIDRNQSGSPGKSGLVIIKFLSLKNKNSFKFNNFKLKFILLFYLILY